MRPSFSKPGTESPKPAMSFIHGSYKEDPEYPEKPANQDGGDYGPFSSPSSDFNSLPRDYFFEAALATIIVMLAVAALVWRFYVPPPLVL